MSPLIIVATSGLSAISRPSERLELAPAERLEVEVVFHDRLLRLLAWAAKGVLEDSERGPPRVWVDFVAIAEMGAEHRLLWDPVDATAAEGWRSGV